MDAIRKGMSKSVSVDVKLKYLWRILIIVIYIINLTKKYDKFNLHFFIYTDIKAHGNAAHVIKLGMFTIWNLQTFPFQAIPNS